MFFYALSRLSVDLDFDILQDYSSDLKDKIIKNLEPILKTF
jgi:predicted nucleotidyltransferase component of viral defense system